MANNLKWFLIGAGIASLLAIGIIIGWIIKPMPPAPIIDVSKIEQKIDSALNKLEKIDSSKIIYNYYTTYKYEKSKKDSVVSIDSLRADFLFREYLRELRSNPLDTLFK